MEQYRSLMRNIVARFGIIDGLKLSESSQYHELETAAFHLRKSIEGVAFGCLVAMENGLKFVPRDAVGQWNADKIFSKVEKRKPLIFPLAAERTDPIDGDGSIQHHLIPNAEDNLSVQQVRSVYRRSHVWLHEINPYVGVTMSKFEERRSALLADIIAIWKWLLFHVIVAEGEVFLTVLKTPSGQLEVSSATANFGTRR